MSNGGTFSPPVGPGARRGAIISRDKLPLHTNGRRRRRRCRRRRRRRRGATRPCGVTLIYFHRKLTGIYFTVGSHPANVLHPYTLPFSGLLPPLDSLSLPLSLSLSEKKRWRRENRKRKLGGFFYGENGGGQLCPPS